MEILAEREREGMTDDQLEILRRLRANKDDGICIVDTAKDLMWDQKRVRNAIDGLKKRYKIKNHRRGWFKLC